MIRRTVVIALVAGLALALGGCVVATKEQVTTIPVPHQAGSALAVTAHNGCIVVRKSSEAEVRITAKLRMVSDDRLAGTTIAANRDNAGVLTIFATPPNGHWMGNEGCAFDISVPDARNVTLKSSNGRIEAAGLSGTMDAKTSNGSVTVSSHDGPVQASSSNGKIEVSSAGPVDCRTSNGAVKVTVSGPGPVTIDTSNGSISLVLGDGFVGTISARTSNGSVSAPKPDKGRSYAFERHGKSRAKLAVGGSDTPSSLETSNGSISISFAP